MRVASWNPNREDQTFENIAMDRLQEGADVLRAFTFRRLMSVLYRGWQGVRPISAETAKRYSKRSPVSHFSINRRIYTKAYDGHTVPGKKFKYPHYTGASWTARIDGELMRSVRTVRKLTPSGKALSGKRNIRVYVGHYNAFYAAILEYYQPFFRPALNDAFPSIKKAVGAD